MNKFLFLLVVSTLFNFGFVQSTYGNITVNTTTDDFEGTTTKAFLAFDSKDADSALVFWCNESGTVKQLKFFLGGEYLNSGDVDTLELRIDGSDILTTTAWYEDSDAYIYGYDPEYPSISNENFYKIMNSQNQVLARLHSYDDDTFNLTIDTSQVSTALSSEGCSLSERP